jgi:hypothetical protein
MAIFNIPIAAPGPQSFTVSLAGFDYQLTLKYRNTDDGGWTLDIADSTGNPLLSGEPLVTGIDLLDQYQHLGFNGSLYVQTTADPDAVPTFENLGTDALLYWVPAI